MSKRDYITLLALPISQLTDPRYRQLLREYAGEIAPACVAEAFMRLLGEAR